MGSASLIEKITALPTPEPVLRHIAAVVSNPGSNAGAIAEALKLDPATAGRVLRLANSAYIGMPRRIASLQNAVVLLGLKRIRSLLFIAQFAGPFSKQRPHALPLERFWRHSTMVALIAESIARHIKRYDPIDEQEVFTAAIMHDIGKLVLAVLEGGRLAAAAGRSRQEVLPFCRVEDEEWSHTAVGAALSDQWGFPPELAAGIAGHHVPGRVASTARFVSVIHVADCMVHVIGHPVFEGEGLPLVDDRALASVGLPFERLRTIAETEAENQRNIEELCDIFV